MRSRNSVESRVRVHREPVQRPGLPPDEEKLEGMNVSEKFL